MPYEIHRFILSGPNMLLITGTGGDPSGGLFWSHVWERGPSAAGCEEI